MAMVNGRQAREPVATSELFLRACVVCSLFSVLRFPNITADQFRWGGSPTKGFFLNHLALQIPYAL